MEKLSLNVAGKYLFLGAGAVAMSVVATKVSAISALLIKIPFWNQDILGATVGSILLAGLGVGLIDQLVYKK